MSFPENWKLTISEWLQHTDVSALFLYQLITHFLPFFLSLFLFPRLKRSWVKSLNTGGSVGLGWGSQPSPFSSPQLLQLLFFLCPGQEMDIIHSKEKKSTWKSALNFSYTHVTGWNRDGFRDGWKTAPDMDGIITTEGLLHKESQSL